MKNISFYVSLFLLLFAGCSSTYRLTNFYSKEKFYNDFNNSIKTKDIKVTLINDSSFTASDGTSIKNDTLISCIKLVEKNIRQFALSDISEINYTNNDYKSATVLLKTREELITENVRIIHDSICFVEIKSLKMINNIPLNQVKIINYKKRWLGIFPGAIAGLFSGALVGGFRGKKSINSHGESQELIGTLFGASIGFITGGIAGYFFGYSVTYEFNK